MSAADDAAAAIQAVADAIGVYAADPGDGIRLLLVLAGAPAPADASKLGVATAARCRRAALIAACRASSTWQPASSDDAQAMMGLLVSALDAEITVAGDAGEDSSFQGLEALRAAVIGDLSARGAELASLVDVPLPGVTNTLALAASRYGDATREPEIEQRIDPVHPLFVGGIVRILAR